MHSTFHQSGQTGSALVIALIFLLLLTLIGVTAMQGTTLQERMAGNARDRNLAFQGAEAALRACEAWIDAKTVDIVTPALADPADWNGSNPAATPGCDDYEIPRLAPGGGPVAHVAEPRLVRNDVDPMAPVRSLYTVTSRSTGGVDTTVVILQSIFCESPCR